LLVIQYKALTKVKSDYSVNEPKVLRGWEPVYIYIYTHTHTHRERERERERERDRERERERANMHCRTFSVKDIPHK
jgi:hypothetical protein